MSFKAINWTPSEMVGEAKMDAMTDNAEWLYRNTPRAIYTTSGGLRRVEGTRIVAGRVLVAKRAADSATVQVRFGNFFSTRCDPIVTTGVVSDAQTQIFCVISGIGQLLPDSRGFNVGVNVAAEVEKNDKISESFYVTWHAMGY